jgi:hypothetical protein
LSNFLKEKSKEISATFTCNSTKGGKEEKK